MSLSAFLKKINITPEAVSFDNCIAVIDENYIFKETAFLNGGTKNEVGQNNGSCKILAFGHLNNLTEEQTSQCFGDYYRKDVLGNPDGNNHQNIRNFIQHGWAGVSFEGDALALA